VFRFLRTVPVLLILGGGFAGAYIGVDGLVGANHAKAAMARHGGDPASLLRASNLIPALNAVSGKVGNDAALQHLTIYPGYLVADVAAGREHTDLDGVHDAIVAVDPPSRKQRITASLDGARSWEAQLDGGGLRRAAGR
jgi:hypothetical protein